MPHRWSDSAELRCHQIESGLDVTFNDIFKPLFVRRLESLKPRSVLEIGAGTGHLAQEISRHGFAVTALEPSLGMFAVAQRVLASSTVKLIHCRSFDLPVENTFDTAISHLVAHVVEDLPRFIASVGVHLPLGGYFLMSLPHPCFYNQYKKFFGSEYSYMAHMAKEVSFSISHDKTNEITGVPYHHRPLSAYINAMVKSGFAVDGLDEIFPEDLVMRLYPEAWEYPRYCLFSCRKL